MVHKLVIYFFQIFIFIVFKKISYHIRRRMFLDELAFGLVCYHHVSIGELVYFRYFNPVVIHVLAEFLMCVHNYCL